MIKINNNKEVNSNSKNSLLKSWSSSLRFNAADFVVSSDSNQVLFINYESIL